MKVSRGLDILCMISTAIAVCASPVVHDGLTISTTSGWIRGKVDLAEPNVRQFLGIPFAQPPVGTLRFDPPEAFFGTEDVIDVTELPPSCMQSPGLMPSIYNRDVLEFNIEGLNDTVGRISEDCLTLSIWTPSQSRRQGRDSWEEKLLPVLIFIHGGGFGSGGQNVPYQIPTQWVQRTQSHLVVTLNYRLNIFGYPNAAAQASGQANVGLLDQRLAVEWVRDNIAKFGGDPSRMVLWGQSAGAASVSYYAYSYLENPIVTGFIVDSDVVRDTSSVPDTSNFTYVASQLGCSDLSPAEELDCMRRVPADDIRSFIANYSEPLPLSFSPIPDNATVPSNFTDRVLSGQSPSLPFIIGTNAQDGLPWGGYDPAGPNLTLIPYGDLNTFFCPSNYHVTLRQQADLPTFVFYYAGNFTNISPRGWMGAYHSSELPMLFGTHANYRGESTPFEIQTSVDMQDAWLEFAAGGVKALQKTGWAPSTMLGGEDARNFGNETTGKPTTNISLEFLAVSCDGPNMRK